MKECKKGIDSFFTDSKESKNEEIGFFLGKFEWNNRSEQHPIWE